MAGRIYAAFPKTGGGNLRGGGRQVHSNLATNGADAGRRSIMGGELTDIVESRAMAGIIGGPAYLWTATNLYSIARDNTSGDLHVTLVGDHGLGRVTAAAYWPASQRFIVCARDKLFFFDPATREAEPVLSATPAGTRSLFVKDNRLYALAADVQLARFDSATIAPYTAQQVVERDRWEIRFRERKSHEIRAILTPNEIVEAEFNWRATTSASGRVQVSADVLDPDLLDEAAYPSAAAGGLDVELFREHPLGTDQYLGIVSSMNFLRGPTTNVSTLVVGDIINSVWVLGERATGTGGAECRRIAEVGDPFLIEARGIHQGIPIDARGSSLGPELEARGRAEMERHLRKLKVDDDVDFTRSQRIDRIDFYLDDPWTYFDRRYSDPGTEEARSYGGPTAGDYIANMVREELELNPPGFDRNRQRDLTLDAQFIWERRSIGASFNVRYVRTRLLEILEQAVLAGNLVLAYEVDNENQLRMRVQPIRDRTLVDVIRLVDGGETVDPDSVYPGDRVERELVVGQRAVGSGSAGMITATDVRGQCGASGSVSEAFTSADPQAGVLVLQRQIRIDGQRGLQVKLSTGDIALEQQDVQRAFVGLSNAARVG